MEHKSSLNKFIRFKMILHSLMHIKLEINTNEISRKRTVWKRDDTLCTVCTNVTLKILILAFWVF